MTPAEFSASLANAAPPAGLTPALTALWWDGKGDWTRAHDLINDMETTDTMAVQAYLHRKEGEQWNADYCIAEPAIGIAAPLSKQSGTPWSKRC